MAGAALVALAGILSSYGVTRGSHRSRANGCRSEGSEQGLTPTRRAPSIRRVPERGAGAGPDPYPAERRASGECARGGVEGGSTATPRRRESERGQTPGSEQGSTPPGRGFPIPRTFSTLRRTSASSSRYQRGTCRLPSPTASVIGIVGETPPRSRPSIAPSSLRVARRIALPPLRSEQADVARLERAGLDRGGEAGPFGRAPPRSPSNGTEPSPIGAAHEPIAFARELRDVVLQVDVTDAMRGAAGEGDRILADRERVAGIETDAGVRAEPLDDLEQLLAAEVLMILDRQDQAGVADAIATRAAASRARERSSRASALPSCARPPSSTGRQMKAENRRAKRGACSGPHRAASRPAVCASQKLQIGCRSVQAAREAACSARRPAASATDDRARCTRSPSSRTSAMKPSRPIGCRIGARRARAPAARRCRSGRTGSGRDARRSRSGSRGQGSRTRELP